MRTAKRTLVTLVMAALLLTMLGTSVFAAEPSRAWLKVTPSAHGTTLVSVMADIAVTDAYLEVTFDSSVYGYVSAEVDSTYVDVYSINADEAGKIKIAFVAEGDYEAAETGVVLITIIFNGQGEAMPAMSGQLHDSQGNALSVGETVLEKLDLSELTKAVLIARNLQASPYTAESYEAMRAVLAEAEVVLTTADSQDEVDAAAQALLDAIENLALERNGEVQNLQYDALEKAILKAEALNRYDYTKDSFAVMEAALQEAKTVLNDTAATQAQVDAAAVKLNDAIRALVLGTGVPDTGAESMAMPLLALAIFSAAGIVATVCLLNSKKGRCRK